MQPVTGRRFVTEPRAQCKETFVGRSPNLQTNEVRNGLLCIEFI